MAYTMEDFRRDSLRVYIERWPELPDDIRQAIVDSIPVEERLRGVDPQVWLRGLDPDWVEAWLKRIGH